MVEQEYYLDMIPGESTPPVVHVSQYDKTTRTLTFNLMKGGVAYEPEAGMNVTLDGTKPDNTAFSYPMTVNGSSVSIACREQMTVVAGHVRCEVTVSNTSGTIGSANFILAVEEAAIDTGAISDTDIPIFIDLKNQAQQAAANAAQSATEAEDAADSVSAIVPASAGTAGQVLTKTATGADWDDVDGLPAGGTAGQVLTKTAGGADWQTPASLSAIATVESVSPYDIVVDASKAYSIGDYLVFRGQLYSVIAAIAKNDRLVVGTNIAATTVGEELTPIKSVTFTGTTNNNGIIAGAVTTFGAPTGAVFLFAYLERGSLGTVRYVKIYAYGNAGYALEFGNNSGIYTETTVTCRIYYVVV